MLQFVPKLVIVVDIDMITHIPSCNEIRQAVFYLEAPSAGATNCLHGVFYHQCWSIIQRDVCQAVQEFFHVGKVHKYLNTNLVICFLKLKVLM